MQIFGLDLELSRKALGDLHRRRAQRGADLALEVAHARLARVVADDRLQRIVRDRDLIILQTVGLELALHQISFRDLELLLLGVPGELDDLHAVAQRPGDRVEHVRGGDEHHLRQVEVDAEVVVAEVRVLLRVQDLEQRARRVAMEAALPELVDLVEHQHHVLRLGAAQRLDDVAG